MNAALLLKLVPGQQLTSPSGATAVVLAAAVPTRAHGWRVQLRTQTGTCWLTPTNVQDWQLGPN